MRMSDKVYDIPLREIDISSFNVRQTGARIGIEDLADSINKHGLLQPVALRGSHGNPPYELIVGQRRLLAHRLLGKDTIRAVFCGEVSDWDARVLSLTENLHRLELNYADKAEAITQLYVYYGRDVRRVAQELHLHPSTVRSYVKIDEQATDKAKQFLREKRVTKTDVRRVIDAAQGDDEKADQLLDKMKDLTRYEKDRAVQYGKRHPEATAGQVVEDAKKPRIVSTVILSLPKEIDRALNTAARTLLMDPESIAVRALSEWLRENGYLVLEQ